MYFKPSRQVPYTVNCFVGHDFARIVKLLEKSTVGNPLQFHDASGMGSLNLALLMGDRTVGTGGVKKRVSMSAFAIETAFGLWVPSAYVDQVEDRIESASEARLHKLIDQGRRLDAASNGMTANRIHLYLHAIDSRLPRADALSEDQRATISDRIRRNLKRLVLALTDEHSLERLSRPFTGIPVPEFWEDEQSGDEIFETYVEYVAYKLAQSSRMERQSSIIYHLATCFELDSDDDAPAVREKMEGFFKRGGVWPLNDWPKAAREEIDTDG